MSYLTLSTIRKQVKELAKAVNAPKELTVVSSSPDWMGSIYVEVNDSGYHYIEFERGEELERQTTTDIRELLYWILKDIIRNMALKYELKNRQPNVDSRKLRFNKQLELMNLIDAEYGMRLEEEIKLILKDYPFENNEKE